MSLRSEIRARMLTVSGIGEVYADEAPDSATYPHAVLTVDETASPALKGDGAVMAWQRDARIDLWEERGSTEGETLRTSLRDTLDGFRLTDNSKLRVQSSLRDPDATHRVVHHIMTIRVITLR
jgi:hypothetical protein